MLGYGQIRGPKFGLEIWQQGRRMTTAEQMHFVHRFEVDGRGIGFAVLGGRFAEGIDLPGRRLVGAFIATLGMPQVNPVNEQMRRLMQRQFGCGYEFTYLYPGLRKVAQAAGRVIRSTTDRGVVYLIDDRFKTEVVRELMPRWWTPRMLQESSTSITFAKGSQQSSVSTPSPASWLDNYQ